MKVLIAILLFKTSMVAASPDNGNADTLVQYLVKGYVVLNDNQKILVYGISYADSYNLILFVKQSNMVNGSYTYNEDVKAMKKYKIPIGKIKLIKFKRQAFAKGATTGGAIGFGGGYIAGFASYNDDDYLSNEENSDNRSDRGFVGGIVMSIPTALAGGIFGGLLIKKRFWIDGSREKLRHTLDKLFPAYSFSQNNSSDLLRDQ